GFALARVDGRLVMRHDFYHKSDGNAVETGLLGYLEFEPASGKIRSFRLVTDGPTYGGRKFRGAVRSQEPRTRGPSPRQLRWGLSPLPPLRRRSRCTSCVPFSVRLV